MGHNWLALTTRQSCRIPGTMDLHKLDKAVQRYFGFLFFDGCGLWEGGSLLHGLAFVFRPKRAITGWARMQPAPSRAPGPSEVVYFLQLSTPRCSKRGQNAFGLFSDPQVMSPTSLTTSTTQRLPKSSSKRNPATKTRSLRTCVTRNSTMSHRESAIFTTVHSGARRTSGPTTSFSRRKFVASSVLFHTHEWGDPYTNLVRVNEYQVAAWKTSESGLSLKDKKIKFSLILEPRFRNMNFKPILIDEVYSGIEWNYGVSAKRN